MSTRRCLFNARGLLRTCVVTKAIALLGFPCFAQNNAKTPDQQWSALLQLANPVPLSRNSNNAKITAGEAAAAIGAQAKQARDAADAARKFYLDNPADPKATEARKIEVLCSLRGAEGGTRSNAQAALAMATSYRDDVKFTKADRCEVALAAERFSLGAQLSKKPTIERMAEWKKLGDKLYAEFGDQPSLQTYYISLARRLDIKSAATLADTITRSQVAPAPAKAEAASIVARAGLIGKQVHASLSTLQGIKVDLAGPFERPTVVVFWRPGAAPSLDILKKAAPITAEVIYVALGGTTADVAGLQATPPLPGRICRIEEKQRSARLATQFNLWTAPYVYVFERNGKVAGCGRPDELQALLQAIAK